MISTYGRTDRVKRLRRVYTYVGYYQLPRD